jgi:16S rRNA (guanine527-N7)-methyltransferase
VSLLSVHGQPLPPPPPAARRILGEALPLAESYAAMLATTGVERGLIGPREVPRLWERHLLNCAVVTDLVPSGADVCDLGTGAGLPGVLLALRRPDLSLTLVDPLLRRTAFLTEVVAALELANVEILRTRAEELHGSGRQWTVVTARALAPMSRLVGWALPLVRPGGSLLAMKGSRAQDEVDDATEALTRWDSADVSIRICGEAEISPPTTVVRVGLKP